MSEWKNKEDLSFNDKIAFAVYEAGMSLGIFPDSNEGSDKANAVTTEDAFKKVSEKFIKAGLSELLKGVQIDSLMVLRPLGYSVGVSGITVNGKEYNWDLRGNEVYDFEEDKYFSIESYDDFEEIANELKQELNKEKGLNR